MGCRFADKNGGRGQVGVCRWKLVNRWRWRMDQWGWTGCYSSGLLEIQYF